MLTKTSLKLPYLWRDKVALLATPDTPHNLLDFSQSEVCEAEPEVALAGMQADIAGIRNSFLGMLKHETFLEIIFLFPFLIMCWSHFLKYG